MVSTRTDIYRRTMAVLPVCMSMTRRGLGVNDALRQERIKLLAASTTTLMAQAQDLLTPEIWDALTRWDLFLEEPVCKSCHNGKKKRASCTSCGGAGRFHIVQVNLGSEQQLKNLLYTGIGLPTRSQKGKVTTDEEALQSLLALDTSGFVALALRYAKLATMKETYERIAPAADGRVRTVFNPAGTYTGRFASAKAFYVPFSTALHNLSAHEAARDPLYAVRDCIVPRRGRCFLYADLSQAEARVVAACAADAALMDRWASNPDFDVHRWTAATALGSDIATITSEQRYLYKRARHALNYGMGSSKFWRVVNADADLTGVAITQPQAKKVHQAYHALHPQLERWWDQVEIKLRQGGTISNCFGRTCNFYPRFDPMTGEPDAETLRDMVAFEPQSTVADVKIDALIAAAAAEDGFEILFEGHDSLLTEADPRRVQHVARTLKRCLERPITVNGHALTIPVEVFVCPTNWSHMERIL